jgi:hypothetical protein
MIRIDISEDALADLDAGFWFYEAQETGLGDYFAACLRSDLEGLKIFAGIHRKSYQDYHRMLGKTFPFAIYYTLEAQIATVWAVIDCRRDPDWIRDRLGR